MTKDQLYSKIVEYILENQEKFYRLAYSYTRNKDEALDVVQNAICKALEKYADIRDFGKINSWFYKVLLNETYSHLKRYNREFAATDEQMPEGVYQESAYDKDDELYQQINALPKHLKTIVILRFFEEMPLAEIAAITGINLNTVKTRLYSALKKLKNAYKEAGADE